MPSFGCDREGLLLPCMLHWSEDGAVAGGVARRVQGWRRLAALTPRHAAGNA